MGAVEAALLILPALVGWSLARGDADIDIKYAQTCGIRFLRESQSPRVPSPNSFYGSRQGRWPRRRAKVSFQHALVEIQPSRGEAFRIPGCMTLHIRNVTIQRRIENIAAEYQMRAAGRPDPKRPKIDCAQNQGTSLNECTCGTRNNCLFCSFCENIQNRQHRQGRDRGRMALLGEDQRPSEDKCGHSCPRTEEPGLLDMTADICTPGMTEMREHLDEESVAVLAADRLSMFTAVWIYERRGRHKAASAVRNMDVVGCFLLGYDVAISQEFKERLAKDTLSQLRPAELDGPSSTSAPSTRRPPWRRREPGRSGGLRIRHEG